MLARGGLSEKGWAMSPGVVSGTQGYAEAAERLFPVYEGIPFEDVHRSVLHLFPEKPCRILDIGSGTGRDAAAFAATGHAVTAVEPTAELRLRATTDHASPNIEWIDDGLPDLSRLASRSRSLDLVLLTTVWMHLDEAERRRAMPPVAGLVRPGGTLIMSLRHGPVPEGRRMFEVSGDETVALAMASGLSLSFRRDREPSAFPGRSDVLWTRLAFTRSERTAT